MKPGLFVSFEGIEGCGKTTQIALLSEQLTAKAIPHTITREPGGTPVGEEIRPILLNSDTTDLTAAAELLLFYASRHQNIVENIKPALERGDVVISDRYFDSSLAYQGYGRGLPLDFIEGLTDQICGTCRPDVTFLLDIEPETGLTRAKERNKQQSEDEGRFEAETLQFYGRVRQGYLELAGRPGGRIRVIEGNRPVEAVGLDVRRILEID